MKRTKLARLTALLLTVLMLAGAFTAALPVMAAEADGSDSGSGPSLQQISEELNAKSYLEYSSEYEDVPRATDTVVVDAAGYDAELTDAEVEVYTDYEGSTGKSVMMPDNGKVTWHVNIPKTGKYAVKVDYFPIHYKANSIERVFYINDKVPFAEARYLSMTKVWINDYEATDENGNPKFISDINGNELRPDTTDAP